MNSAHEQCPMNSIQTVTLNSALSQNWVVCTVRTPRNQVARTLHVQCPGRGRCCAHSRLAARMSRAQPAHVTRTTSAGHALSMCRSCAQHAQVTRSACAGRDTPRQSAPGQVVTSFPGRDLKSMSRPASAPPIETSLSRPKTFVATPNHHKVARTMSRHQIDVATPRPVSPRATPKQVIRIARSRLPSLVATSNPA